MYAFGQFGCWRTPCRLRPDMGIPEQAGAGSYLIPTYRLTVTGTDGSGRHSVTPFEVFRFGVQSKDGRTAAVVGLADAQTHRIKSWIPTYRVHRLFPTLIDRFRNQSNVEKNSLFNGESLSCRFWIDPLRVNQKRKGSSAPSVEDGAWQVYGNFLIHDGPDSATEIFATIGCIEIMGPSGFVKFNELIINLSGPRATTRDAQLAEIGRAGNMIIRYDAAARPALVRAP